jgi:putative membrane protein
MQHNGDILKGLAVGAISGLAATWTMTQAQNLSSRLLQQNSGEQEQPEDRAEQAQAKQPEQEHERQEEAPSTEKVATAVSRRMFHKELRPKRRQQAGQVVHYGFGMVMGAAYGALVEVIPTASAGHGTLYGVGLWLMADEVAVPAFRLSDPPTEQPLSSHAQAFGFHLVYGLALEQVRRVIDRLI